MDLIEAKSLIDKGIVFNKTIIIVGDCRVQYHGRAASKLANGERIVIIKSDGCFLVHQNKNLAAINYQPPKGLITTRMEENELVLSASRRKPKELLEAIFSKVFFAKAFDLKDDSSLKVFGTEKELSDILMDDLEVIEKGLRSLKQESPLSKGMIDILAEDKDGNLVVIEIKRRTADLSAVTQLKRYTEEVNKRLDKMTRGILCAPKITPNALRMLEKERLEYFKLDYEIHNPRAEIKGVSKKQRVLHDFSDN